MTPAESITLALQGRWHGSYGEARCPVHDDRTPSLTVRNGDRSPIVKCHRGCNSGRIVEVLRNTGRWPECEGQPRSQFGSTAGRERDRLEYARSVWHHAHRIDGSAAETYLREARGIRGPLPPTLRYAVLKHTDTGLLLPAMVAAVQAPDRSICAVHRTFLRADGLDKAPVSKPRKALGRYIGGAIRLAAAGTEMAIGEGIETTLSYMQASGLSGWAAVSAGNLRNIVLPPLPAAETVHVLVDLDDAGEAAAAVAARRLSREGRKIKLARPTVGRDFNDAIRRGGRA